MADNSVSSFIATSLNFNIGDGSAVKVYSYEKGYITAEATEEVFLSAQTQVAAVRAIDDWVNIIRNIGDSKDAITQELVSVELKKETDSIKYQIRLGDLIVEEEYDMTTQMIKNVARPAYTIGWATFLFWLDAESHFLSLILGRKI